MLSNRNFISESDRRKFSVSFGCNLVGQKVDFNWTEVADGDVSAKEHVQLESLTCSGIGMSGCPVASAEIDHHGWQKCPRMERLQRRLTSSGPVSPLPA
jgi:hypothetical protein